VTAAISMIDRMAKTADLTKLVSGSDDGSVKLWDMNQAILLLHLLCVSF
jgi:WD40 repeat protein